MKHKKWIKWRNKDATIKGVGMKGHGRIICKECKTIIARCRCMENHKNITYDLCEKCKPMKPDNRLDEIAREWFKLLKWNGTFETNIMSGDLVTLATRVQKMVIDARINQINDIYYWLLKEHYFSRSDVDEIGEAIKKKIKQLQQERDNE